ncbi:MAG TPA: hypothetical protein DCX03_00795 [Bacteroidales bacterium]|nr:hypothetical protein [Bacteroidales bacterium]
MKKIILLIITVIASVCYAAQPVNTSVRQQSNANTNVSADTETTYSLSCDSYESCVDLGLKERNENLDSVLIYYNEGKKETRYNLFENISVSFGPNVCPPIVNVYKKINNINYLMDVFTKKDVGECVTYVANITGEGRFRDVVTSQLEIKFCNKDELFETCDQSIVYSKINKFGKSNEKILPVVPDIQQNTAYPSISDSQGYNQSGNPYIGQNMPNTIGGTR